MNEEKVELIEETDLDIFELSEGDDENSKIKDELLAITWAPNRVRSWCLDIEEQINIEQFKE